MNAILFPGQGAQKVGMGKELFELFPSFVAEARDVLQCKIDEICLYDENNQLSIPEYTQPAIFLVEALAYKKYVMDFGNPNMCAGHSLGEYAALFASGALSFSDGLRLTQKRGEIMGKISGGKMAAVVGVPEEVIRERLVEARLDDKLTLANFNTQKQTVLSGLENDVLSAEHLFDDIKRSHFVVLEVSGAFHSKYMIPAADEFAIELSKVCFKEIAFPVISNVDARPYNNNLVSTLKKHMTSPVLWKQTLNYMINSGMELISMEPHGPMPGMIRTTLKEQ